MNSMRAFNCTPFLGDSEDFPTARAAMVFAVLPLDVLEEFIVLLS